MCVSLLLPAGDALGQAFLDKKVQAPELKAPERAMLAGSLSGTAFGPGELSRGAYRLPGPFEAPTERGPLLADVFPGYSPDSGLSEWGMGWASALAIARFRVFGDLDYATDELTSPWGRLVPGTDGYWYAAGQPGVVKLRQLVTGQWEALTEIGTRFVFGESIDTARGSYQWMLTRATTPSGEVTELSYVRNASGRPFLSIVEYGGRGRLRQVQVEFEYERLATPFNDYRSGERLDLDRRVKLVHVSTRDGGTGAFAPRWTYELSYTSSPVSQVFYLTAVDRRFASGELEPRITYEYDLAADAIDAAVLVHVDELDTYLSEAGDVALRPDKVAFFDLEGDGLTDLEHHYAHKLVHRVDDAYVFQDLPTDTTTDPACRPSPSSANPPRMLARMTASAMEPQVVHTSPAGGSTSLRVCDRVGRRLQDVQRLSGTWSLGRDPTVRLVDLNRDRRPDLLRVWPGGYQVLPNESDRESYAFGPLVNGTLSTVVTLDTVWVQEMNGDGMVDLVVRHADGLAVFLGKGNFAFESVARSFSYRTLSGTFVTNPQAYEHTFADVNHDGLMDVLLSKGTVVHLFANNGAWFQEIAVPAFSTLSWNRLYPVAADLSGRGETEIVFVKDSKAYALALTRPGTGLLRAADDGKGTVVRFTYGRALPEPGTFHRPSVLSRLEVESSGRGVVAYDYDYAGPVMHTEGRHLVGYRVARRAGSLSTDEVTFHHDDDLVAVVLSQVTTDRSTPAYRFTETEYEERVHARQRWWRPTRQVSGWRSLDASEEVSEELRFETYSREVCPTRTRRVTAHGELVTEIRLADPADLAGVPHCLSAQERLTGVHADSSLDFVYTVNLARNAMGDITQVTAMGDTGPLVLQRITYDADHRVVGVSSPGQGETSVTYDDGTGQVASVVGPTGVTSVGRYHPVRDVLEELQENRGATWTGHFRYDGFERLQRSWDSVSGSGEQPLEAFEYRYASHEAPGRMRIRARKGGVHAEALALLTAAGEEIATATRIPEGWAVGTVIARDPSRGETQVRFRSTLPGDMPATRHGDLLEGAALLALTRRAGLGHDVLDRATVQTDVERVVARDVAVVEGTRVVTETENEIHVRRAGLDAAGNVLWSEDEVSSVVRYQYDALGRLVGVTLPDGVQHTLRYDAYGRPTHIERERVASITTLYDPTTGLPSEKRVASPTGRLERVVSWLYDGAARPVQETHHQPETRATRSFTFAYDGARSDGPTIPGQRGHLTQVTGEGLRKTFAYDQRGQLARRILTLDGWREVEEQRDYYDDGTLRTTTWTVRDTFGTELHRVTIRWELDAYGRPASLLVGGETAAELLYDAEGKLARVDFGGERHLALHHDAATRAVTGFRIDAEDWNVGVDWALDGRGNVSREDYRLDDDLRARTFTYDARGFLRTASEDGAPLAQHAYGADGRLQRTVDQAGPRDLERIGSHVYAGDVTYMIDDLGRVDRKSVV